MDSIVLVEMEGNGDRAIHSICSCCYEQRRTTRDIIASGIDGRDESSFNPRDVYFPDYDANQLRKILKNRRDASVATPTIVAVIESE